MLSSGGMTKRLYRLERGAWSSEDPTPRTGAGRWSA